MTERYRGITVQDTNQGIVLKTNQKEEPFTSNEVAIEAIKVAQDETEKASMSRLITASAGIGAASALLKQFGFDEPALVAIIPAGFGLNEARSALRNFNSSLLCREQLSKLVEHQRSSQVRPKAVYSI